MWIGVLVVNRPIIAFNDMNQRGGLAGNQIAFPFIPILNIQGLAEFMRNRGREASALYQTFPKSSGYSPAISDNFFAMSLKVCQSLRPSQEH